MAKRRTNNEGGVSLFPFMSILACLIGILTLMISVSMQVKQMENQDRSEEEQRLAVANRDLKNEAAKLEKELARLDERLTREKATSAELAKIEDRKIVLRVELEDIEKASDESDEALQKRIENMKLEAAALKRERPPLDKRLEELKAELAKRKDPPKPVESVVIRPGGTGISVATNLFFVECTSTGIVLHSGKSAPQTISKATISNSDEYNAFLDEVKATRDAMVLFLIRKGGNESYAWAAGWAESKYEVLTGKLPIPNEGNIDLSLFQK